MITNRRSRVQKTYEYTLVEKAIDTQEIIYTTSSSLNPPVSNNKQRYQSAPSPNDITTHPGPQKKDTFAPVPACLPAHSNRHAFPHPDPYLAFYPHEPMAKPKTPCRPHPHFPDEARKASKTKQNKATPPPFPPKKQSAQRPVSQAKQQARNMFQVKKKLE